MKHPVRTTLLMLVFLISLALRPQSAAAHGTGHRIRDARAAIVVEFIYADHNPMPYAEVLVFSPADKEIEYQNGRTDRKGRFAFYPNIPGVWRIQADDGLGHLERVSIEIAARKNGGSGQGGEGDQGGQTGEGDQGGGSGEDGQAGDAGWDRVAGQSEARAHYHDHDHHHGLPRPWGLLLGVSLILNLFIGFYLIKSNRRKRG
jgi:nickel transport protein